MKMFGPSDFCQCFLSQLQVDLLWAGNAADDKPSGLVVLNPWLGGLKQS